MHLKFSRFVLACIAVGFLSSTTFGYSHSDYAQNGLIVQYDAPDNVDSTTKLTNFGSLGSTYDLSSLSDANTVVGGVIAVNGYNGKGWGMGSKASTATKGDTAYTEVGYTVEYVGLTKDTDTTARHPIGSDAVGSTSPGPFRLSTYGKDSRKTGCEALANSYGYENAANFKAFEGQLKGSERATRSFTVNSVTGEIRYYENGMYVGNYTVKPITDRGIQSVNLGDLRKGRGYNAWSGEMYSIRIYNRILTAEELSSNAETDAYRFLGKTESGQLTITTEPNGIGRPSPSSGTYSAPKETMVCTATEPFYQNGVRYVCTGYTLEEQLENGEWGAPVTYEGTSLEYAGAKTAMRLTWHWIPTHYRLYVTKHGGTETFELDPAPDITDEADETVGGYYASGTAVAVRAIPSTMPVASVFEGWTGDMGTDSANANPIGLTLDQSRTIVAGFKRPWHKTGDLEVSDGVWTLTLQRLQSTIDDIEAAYSIKKGTGSGVLDMSELNKILVATGDKPVKAIEASAFNGCSAMTGLIFPTEENGEGIAVIGGDAFRGCTNLSGTPNFWALETISARTAFLDITKVSGDLLLPKAKQLIGDRIFRNNGYDGFLSAPVLESAGTASFAGLKITDAHLPSLTSWSEQLFYGMSRLQHITASPEITTIAGNVFEACSFSCCTIDFPKNMPTSAGGVGGSWIIVRVPGKYQKAWLESDLFVPLAQIENVEKQPNYATAAGMKKLVGTWNGAWLVVTPQPGMVVILK